MVEQPAGHYGWWVGLSDAGVTVSSWGGSRNGAGAPARGVSESRRLLLTAIQRGLEIAGRERGIEGDGDQVATQAAAQIAADMIRSGRGDEVLKLYVLAAPASDSGTGGGGRSVLLDALSQLPGMTEIEAESGGEVLGESLPAPAPTPSPDGSGSCEPGTTDCESPAPLGRLPGAQFFGPSQGALLPVGLELAGERGRYGNRAGRAGPATPRTPLAPAHGRYPVDRQNLEKN